MHEILLAFQDLKNNVLTVLSVESLMLIGKVALVVLLIVLFSYIAKFILNKLYLHLKKTRRFWDDILIASLISPIIAFIVIIGVTIIIDIVDLLDKNQEKEVIPLIQNISAIIVISWFALSYIGFSEKRYIERKKRSKKGKADFTSIDLIGKLARISIIIIAGLIIMDLLGIKLTAVLAFAGVGGVAVGFASKDLLANFFGTILIYTDKLFVIGDWIRFPDKTEGIVEEISWRITRIRTLERRQLCIPNSVFSSTAIENRSNATHRRIYEIIGIRYKDIQKLNAIVKDIKSMLTKHRKIDSSEIMYVNFSSFGDSSVNFTIYAFTNALDIINFSKVKHDICLKAVDIIHKHGADIAFPTRVLEIEDSIKVDINQQKKIEKGKK